ncbi:MAG: nuclear transport factor 2 family protein [Myxococcota bacterium]
MNRTHKAAAVADVIRVYIKGTQERDVTVLRQVFHENAVMSGFLGPNKLVGSPEPFFAHLEANPHNGDYTAEITHLDVVGRTARAVLVEDGLYGMAFVNDFHLLFDDGRWLITSKLFHHD